MSVFASQFVSLLAAAQSAGAKTALEFDFPEGPLEWALYGGGFALVIALAVFVYLRDTAGMSWFWKVWLSALRLATLAALIVIAVNPQERTEKSLTRRSRVVLAVDTSLSMRYPESLPPAGTPASTDAEAARSRADAIKALLRDSPLIERLREQHDVSLYTFDSTLSGPHRVFSANGQETGGDAAASDSLDSANGEAANTLISADAAGAKKDAADGTAADGTRSVPATLDWDELLRPRGLETRLGESLLDVIRQTAGETLSGVVVLSDGGSNAGVDPVTAHEVAKSSKVRVVTVGVGSTEPPVNLQIANVQSPTHVHVGDPYEISVFVQGRGFVGRTVELELAVRAGDDPDAKPLPIENGRREITIREDGIPVEVKFPQMPSIAGEVEFVARVKPASAVRELSEEDNVRQKTINVIDRKTRVLLIAGGPMRDYQFVRNMLYRHPGVTTDVWLQTVDSSTATLVSQESDNLLLEFPDSAAQMYEYDVVVAFDPDWKQIPPERLQLLGDWVSIHAGGLMVIAGDIHTSQLAGDDDQLALIQELYPVFLKPYLLDIHFDRNQQAAQAWPLLFTREGRDAGFLQLADDPTLSAGKWKEFPGVYRAYPTAGPKAGTTIYAHFADPRAQNEYGPPILLASQFYGAGRSLYLGSPELWRLRAISDEDYDTLWTKMIREVGLGRLKRGTSRGMLLLERNQYVLGQTVRLRAQLFDPQLKALEADTVVAEVYDPTGKPLVPARRLLRDQNRPGQYTGEFRVGVPGVYRVEVPVPESKEQLVAKVEVVLPNLESDNPQQNAKLLDELTRDTGGRYLRLEECEEELPKLLPNRRQEFVVDERLRTLWDKQWVLFLLAGFLSAEWLTRKLLKLA